MDGGPTERVMRLSGGARSPGKETTVKNLKVRVFQEGADMPDTTVTVPGTVLRIAGRMVPRRAREALRDEGIDLDELVTLAEQPDVRGTLVEIEDHGKHERVVVALE